MGGRANIDDLLAVVKLCREQKVLQAKVGGIEVTLHPSGFISDENVLSLSRKKPDEEEPLPPIDPHKIRLRDLDDEKADEQINGEKVDEKTLYAAAEGDGDPFGR